MFWFYLFRWVPLSLVAFLCLAQTARAGDLAEVKARGKLVMLCFPTQTNNFISADLDAMREHNLKLAEMRNPDHFKGLDVELAKGFAKSLGVELEIQALSAGYDALLPALVRREGDLVASSLTSTPKRQESADFSEPYYTSWLAVAVPLDSKITSVSDLAGKKAAVVQGSSHLEFLRTLAADVNLLLTDYTLESYVAVQQGQADFTLMDSGSPVGEAVEKPYSDLKVAIRLQEFGYRMAVRKGSDLLAALNAYLDGLRQSGELARMAAKY
jgi:ABC-type amino acid transport substrate-binding protein